MIDAIAIDMHPPAIIQPAKGRSRDRNRTRRGTGKPSRNWTPYAIGAILILSDGSECRVLMDRAGNWICRDERGRVWRLPE